MLDKLLTLGEQPYTKADKEWDAFVAAHPHGSILQSDGWARLKGRFGWKTFRVWLKKDGQLVAGAQILFRSAALGLVKIGYIPHGPLVDWTDDEQVSVLFGQIDQAIYQHRAGMLKIEPLLWQDETSAETYSKFCSQYDFIQDTDTIQPPRTVLIDIRGSEDEILGRMKSKTRYNIRLAGRKEVVVREGGSADIRHFIHLMKTTGQRNTFGVHASDYYQAAYDIFAPDNAAILLAEYEGKPLAGLMAFRNGERAYYLYGASSNEERKRMPTYALQWAAIRWAKKHGCTSYDLWGVPDAPVEELEAQFMERSDGLWGVYRNKRGYGGQTVRTVGCADRVYNKLVYKMYLRRRAKQQKAVRE